MRYLFFVTFAFLNLFLIETSNGKSIKQPDFNRRWNAKWIAAPNDNGLEYGVYYFRKSINLTTKPASFIIHVSADNSYKLYINGTLVSLGPARGDR